MSSLELLSKQELEREKMTIDKINLVSRIKPFRRTLLDSLTPHKSEITCQEKDSKNQREKKARVAEAERRRQANRKKRQS